MSAAQSRAARGWLGWTQAELAQRAQIGLSALKDFEKGNRRTLPAIRLQLQRAFEEAGVEFPSQDSIKVGIPTALEESETVRSLSK
jgi:transcriptional regulator with XRE-family HTH domain